MADWMMLALLALAAFGSGIVNALAGGGAFLTFPTLLAAGIPAIDANASSTVALCPGQFVSAFASREILNDPKASWRGDLVRLSIISLIGGTLGAVLLLVTPSDAFSRLVPWLLLFATTVFAFGMRFTPKDGARWIGPVTIQAVQFVIAIYGGYFGGGIGILMLAALVFYGMRDIRAMNGLKIWLAALMNIMASAIFAFSGRVHWLETLTMMCTGMLGGFVGARLGQIIPPAYVRRFVIAVGCGLTVYFFVKPA
ncbi:MULTISPECIES: sulfite exporter TauE/SafE family protein [unclassified Bradyrhizobium]|uniref:sulfite exporter TauE/SafE family protein n=1 Tax=unclassified Bradyrhizobium TaxID=2631580 RepID=UPI0028F10B85|nr:MULTISPECIES: sulfite exporter TauE/SafE family protein [unclassified Bradyrhizobium]